MSTPACIISITWLCLWLCRAEALGAECRAVAFLLIYRSLNASVLGFMAEISTRQIASDPTFVGSQLSVSTLQEAQKEMQNYSGNLILQIRRHVREEPWASLGLKLNGLLRMPLCCCSESQPWRQEEPRLPWPCSLCLKVRSQQWLLIVSTHFCGCLSTFQVPPYFWVSQNNVTKHCIDA